MRDATRTKSNEIVGRVKGALQPTVGGGLLLPLGERARLLFDLCDSAGTVGFDRLVNALWSLVDRLEASTDGAAAAEDLAEVLELACPQWPRQERRAKPIADFDEVTVVSRARGMRNIELLPWRSYGAL